MKRTRCFKICALTCSKAKSLCCGIEPPEAPPIMPSVVREARQFERDALDAIAFSQIGVKSARKIAKAALAGRGNAAPVESPRDARGWMVP